MVQRDGAFTLSSAAPFCFTFSIVPYPTSSWKAPSRKATRTMAVTPMEKDCLSGLWSIWIRRTELCSSSVQPQGTHIVHSETCYRGSPAIKPKNLVSKVNSLPTLYVAELGSTRSWTLTYVFGAKLLAQRCFELGDPFRGVQIRYKMKGSGRERSGGLWMTMV